MNSQAARSFDIMAKPVCGVCNLSCRYCYYTAKPGDLYPAVKRFMMSDGVLDAYTRQYIEAMPDRCQFGWQGGEPLLAGVDFFRRALDLQQQHRCGEQVITNGLQTNATLLDEQWCELLGEHEFLVGVSLDGPPQWHDAYRKDRAGNPTFGRAWAGLEMLARHGVQFNVLATLNSVNAPHGADIYRFFVNRGIRYLQFIPILERNADGTPTDYSCTPEQFGRFYLEVFEQWAARDVGRVSERFIDSLLHQMVLGISSMCCYRPRCASAFVLEYNGDLYACDHFVYRQWKIGNIMHRPLAELVTDPQLADFAALKDPPPENCRDCEYLEFCHGGCPKHHMPIGTDPKRVNYFCEGYKMFFREALPQLRRIAEHLKQDQLPPREPTFAQGGLSADGPKPARPVVSGPGRRPPGRNDPCPCGSGKKFKLCCGR